MKFLRWCKIWLFFLWRRIVYAYYQFYQWWTRFWNWINNLDKESPQEPPPEEPEEIVYPEKPVFEEVREPVPFIPTPPHEESSMSKESSSSSIERDESSHVQLNILRMFPEYEEEKEEPLF